MTGQASKEGGQTRGKTTGTPEGPDSFTGVMLGAFFILGVVILGVVGLIGSASGIDPWTGVVTFVVSLAAVGLLVALSRLGQPR